MAEIKVTQCTLRRGAAETTAWIPSKFARVGKFLKIRGRDGWKVEQVFTPEQASTYVREHQHQRFESIS